MEEKDYEESGKLYGKVLKYLAKTKIDVAELDDFHYFNDYFKTKI